ncbi:unnamed protein product [Sphagnum jensenii]|uniref:Protein kinase domain-containing protein n=1 Tax=Sphagnum jensenii TaxID=128206 RepID=A0ABP1BP74_9BRYO
MACNIMSWSIACAMQQLLIVMLIFQQLLLGVHSLGNIDQITSIPPFTDQTDVNAIKDLYSAWNNTPNIDSVLHGWNSTLAVAQNSFWDPCKEGSLSGIICYLDEQNETYHVVGLELNGLDLQGELSPAIGSLSSLTYLVITGNHQLTGPLPSTIGQLANLVVMDLHDNNFSGPIPDLSALSNLHQLNLSSNSLVGKVEDVFNLNQSKLSLLDLSSNQLSSGLHIALQFTNSIFRTLDQLNVSRNQLNGSLDDFFTYIFTNSSGNTFAPYVSSIDLSYNQFSGNLMGLNGSGAFQTAVSLEVLSISNNKLSGEFPDLSSFPNLQKLDLSFNQLNGSLPPSIWSIANLNVLDLSENNFSNNLPNMDKSIEGQCPKSLTYLYMAGNSFNGSFPSQLFNCLKKLQVINFDGNVFNGVLNMTINTLLPSIEFSIVRNNISELIPTWDTAIYTPVLLGGNPCCSKIENGSPKNEFIIYGDSSNQIQNAEMNCRYNSSLPNIIHAISRLRSSRKLTLILSITLPSVIAIIGGMIYYITFRQYRAQTLTLRNIQKEMAKQSTIYSYHELRVATQDFHLDNKLGEGNFGVVYKGILSNGTELAIKCLKSSEQNDIGEFLNEVALITGIKHKNLVKLIGYCVRDAQRRFLVYEYAENKNLAEALWGNQMEGDLFLDWSRRFNICVGIAHGLAYLHEELQPCIIHRDIKASNILLDKNLNAKIADFGTARLFPDDVTQVLTERIVGTRGYLSPEYATCGHLTQKLDVYSFGVLLLEIISGKKVMDYNRPPKEINLCNWARSLEENNMLAYLVDERIHNNGVLDIQLQRVIDVAFLCIQTTPENRPLMSHVLAMILGEMEMQSRGENMTPNEIGITILSDFTESNVFSHEPNSIDQNNANVEIELNLLHYAR